MYQWEYRTVKFFVQSAIGAGKIDDAELEKALNQLGAKGWELVTILPGTTRQGELWDFVAVLKREVQA